MSEDVPRVAVSAAAPVTTEALAASLRDHGVEVACVEPEVGRLRVALAAAGHVDVVVMSLRAALADESPPASELAPPVLVVGDDCDDQLEHAVRLGATGYVAWTQPISAVADAARRVAAGESLVPPGMLGGLLRRLIDRSRASDHAMVRLAALSGREREVLALLCDGCAHSDIAELLVVSPQTVRSHIARVLSKLEVRNRTEAVALIHDHGLRSALDAMEVPT